MRSLLRRIAAVGLSALLIWASVNPATAAIDSPSSPPPSGSSPTASTSYSLKPTDFSLMVSPTRIAVGQNDLAKPQKLLVVNQGQVPIAVTVEKRNFIGGSDGSLQFQTAAPYSASEWVTIDPTSFTMEPGESETVVATISLPPAPEPGDHQMAIVFMVPPEPTTAANITINRGIGTPFYITVPGPIDDSVAMNRLDAPGFAIDGPVTLSAVVTNTGTVHRDFRDSAPLLVDGAGTAPPFPDFNVMRGATRDISTTWDPPLICICHPSVHFTNADGSVQSATVQVIVFPLKLLGMVVGALLVGLFAVWFFRRRYRASVTKAAVALHAPVGRGDA